MKEIINEFKYYKKIKQSNLGRDYGWFIKFDGKIIGELEQIEEETYRNSYIIKNSDKKFIKEMKIEKFWHENYERIHYVNREFRNYKTQGIGPRITISDNYENKVILSYRLLHIDTKKNNFQSRFIRFIVNLF